MNDYAGLLAAGERQRLESLLAERERATGAQMVIAIFPSLEGDNLEEFSIRLARQWRIGRKGLDTGVVLLVFVRDRKVRLEVGYGIEPVLPDAVASQIIREAVAPRFRSGRYAEGLEAAVLRVFERVGAEPGRAAPPPPRPSAPSGSVASLIAFAVVLLIVAIVLLQEMLATRRFLGRNAYTAGRRGWSTPLVVLPPWWGGGWSGRGGSGGGGFSGGGGDFGGGGASGGW